MNYVDSDFVFMDVFKIVDNHGFFCLDWLTMTTTPADCGERISRSLGYYKSSVIDLAQSHNVDVAMLSIHKLYIEKGQQPKAMAVDDRHKTHEIYVKY